MWPASLKVLIMSCSHCLSSNCSGKEPQSPYLLIGTLRTNLKSLPVDLSSFSCSKSAGGPSVTETDCSSQRRQRLCKLFQSDHSCGSRQTTIPFLVAYHPIFVYFVLHFSCYWYVSQLTKYVLKRLVSFWVECFVASCDGCSAHKFQSLTVLRVVIVIVRRNGKVVITSQKGSSSMKCFAMALVSSTRRHAVERM